MVYSPRSTAKDLALSLLSAVLLAFSFPKFNIWIFAWIGFIPLFAALKGKSKGKAFLLSYFCGTIFWALTVYWLVHVTLLGVILLVLYLSLYFGVFGLITAPMSNKLRAAGCLVIPSVWVLLEYVRSHLFTGFPWALLGYSQYLNLASIQISDITGVWGVSFILILANVAIYRVIFLKNLRLKEAVALALILISITGYGYYKLYAVLNNRPAIRDKIAVIQGNIPQELKWDYTARDFIVNRYREITLQAVKDKPELVIWPEAALPVIVEEEPEYYERVLDLVKQTRIPLLLGAVTEKENNYYNSALFISPGSGSPQKYDKLHLVPFGEYIPLRKVFPFLQVVVPIGDITPGKDYTVFSQYETARAYLPALIRQDNTVRFSTLICFEDLFPELSRAFTRKGASFLVNITNDAWYQYTSAPYQHLQASVFRAVENRINLVRSANTGISCFINPAGKITSMVRDKTGKDIFVTGYATREIGIDKNNFSFYTRYGDIFIAVCIIFIVCGIIPSLKKKILQ
ncbi:MAG: apolipoprotein N-acyltransferase [Candidatus Omnitrophica bacterium]|nr:apolipoprotein N-acyltransferase [Candidatus Omnitrophota bacterium]